MAQRPLKTSRPISSFLLGLVGTLAVAVAHLAKLDRRVELHALDLRLRHVARSARPTGILHVDIDDRSLTQVGRWPWPREYVARLVEVLQDCRARAVVLDIIMPEPQPVRYVSAAGEIHGTGEAALKEVRPVPVFDDALLAKAIARPPSEDEPPNVFLPMHMDLDLPAKLPLQVRLEEALVPEPTLSAKKIAARLGRTEEQVRPLLTPARKEAVDTRVGRILAAKPQASLQAVLDEVFQGLPPHRAPVVRDATEKSYLRHRAIRSMRRFGIPDERLGDLPIKSGMMFPPLVTLAQAAALSGFVTFKPDPDGIVRRIPLLGRSGEGVYPQFGFAVARHELARRHGGQRPLTADASRVRVACEDGARRNIPVDDEGFMLIRWARGASADEAAADRMVHIPALAVANIWQARDRLRRHKAQAHTLRIRFLSMAIPAEGTDIEKLYLELGRVTDQADEARLQWADEQRRVQRALLYQPAERVDLHVLEQLRLAEDAADQRAREIAIKLVAVLRKPANLDAFLGKPSPPATRPAGTGTTRPSQEHLQAMAQFRRAKQQALQTLAELDDLPNQRRPIEQHLGRMVAEMKALVVGKICMIGSTATGAADFVPTPLGPRTPGVVVHSNILNTVLSGDFLRPSGAVTNILVVLAAGALVSALASVRPVLQSALLTAILASGYASFNALVVFAIWKFWLAVVAPIGAMMASFLVITMYRQLTEERAKRQIKDLFAHAMSPALVDRLLADPSLLELGGQKRAVSCIFADIAGFTALSERLGPQETVRLLNRYFDRVTEVIQNRRGGYLNKFLGDGVFCFFGAPVFLDDHPARAIQAAVDCQAEVTQLNETLSREIGMPTGLSVRIGVTTGEAMVGNCGSTDRMDYTAIGDCVNLASRLEAANKTFGTRILAAEEAWRVGGCEELLARPLGGVAISGFSEPIRVWQVLGPAADAPDEHRKALADFARAIELFDERKFEAALELFQQIEKVLPDDQPTQIFLELCRHGLSGGPDQDLRPQYKKPDETLRITPQQKPPPAE